MCSEARLPVLMAEVNVSMFLCVFLPPTGKHEGNKGKGLKIFFLLKTQCWTLTLMLTQTVLYSHKCMTLEYFLESTV